MTHIAFMFGHWPAHPLKFTKPLPRARPHAINHPALGKVRTEYWKRKAEYLQQIDQVGILICEKWVLVRGMGTLTVVRDVGL